MDIDPTENFFLFYSKKVTLSFDSLEKFLPHIDFHIFSWISIGLFDFLFIKNNVKLKLDFYVQQTILQTHH